MLKKKKTKGSQEKKKFSVAFWQNQSEITGALWRTETTANYM